MLAGEKQFLALAIVLQLLVLALLNGFNVLSTDDIYTIHTTSLCLDKVFYHAINFEQQAPLYFIFLKLWREISDALFWAKMFNYVIYIFNTLVFYKILILLIPDKKDRMIILLFFVFHPFLFFVSNDLRRYSLTLMFGLLSLYYTTKIYIYNKGNITDHILLVVFSSLGVLNDYYHSFLLAGLGLGIILLPEKRKWLFFGEMMVPFAVFLFLLQYILFQLNHSESWDLNHVESNVVFNAVQHTVFLIEAQTYALPFTGLSSFWKMVYRALVILPLALIFRVDLFFKYNVNPKNQFLYLSSALLIFIYFLVVVVLKSSDFLMARYMGFSFPVIFISFFLWILEILKSHKSSWLKAAIVTVLLSTYIFSFSNIDKRKNSHYRNIRNVSLSIDEMLERVPVFAFNSKYAEMINFYNKSTGHVITGIPGPLNFDVYDYNLRFVESDEQLETIFSVVISKETEFLLLVSKVDFYNKRFNLSKLFDYLNDNYLFLSKEEKHGFYLFVYKGS